MHSVGSEPRVWVRKEQDAAVTRFWHPRTGWGGLEEAALYTASQVAWMKELGIAGVFAQMPSERNQIAKEKGNGSPEKGSRASDTGAGAEGVAVTV